MSSRPISSFPSLLPQVVDSGPGIYPRDLPPVSTPLFRSETSRSRETGGARLGLTIARRISQAHGRDLMAGNRAGVGAEFVASFPTD
jgi:two-component system sensor histidine kinase BaeS